MQIIMWALIKKFLIWIGFLGVASAATFATYQEFQPNAPALDAKLCVSSATSTVCTKPLFAVQHVEPKIEGQVACLALRDSDNSGYTYITANNGVLTADAVTCRQ